MSSALKTITAAVASAVLLSSAATAAGLGKLTVLSALGQPLRAEIELTSVSNEEAAGLAAKLASPEAYRAANIEFNPALLSLRFAVEQRGGRQFVRITSPQPLNEPFVDLLLELSWNNGRLVREYTFLLDPAELRTTQSAQVAASPSGATARQGAAAQGAAAPARTPRSERAAAPAGAAAPSGDTPSRVRVRAGDTLSRIAGRIKPVDVSLDMMLVALYRANPDAFIGNNMNRLKSGQILSVPDADALRGLEPGEAHGTVVAHAADFNAYRAKLAGQVATSAPARESAAGQSATGRITAKVEERPTAANEAADRLRLSKAQPAKPGASGATTTTEDTVAKEKELADAQQRVKELENNVSALEKIMTVKSGTGADAAQRADADKAAAAAAGAAAAGAPAATAPAVPAEPKSAPKIKTAPKAAAPAKQDEPGLADMLMDNIGYIAAAAGVLLLGALGVAQRRKQKEVPKAAPATATILGSAAQPSNSLFAKTGGQKVDTHDSVFNSSFAPSASQLDTNEVDPLAEAELYLAYNFDTQAEDILKEALRNDPHRHSVRLKLLEIYAARKDVLAFEAQATELYSLTAGQGEEWAQAAALGHTLDPANPMYAQTVGAAGGAGAAAGVAAGAVAGTAVAAAASADGGPQTLLSAQLEQAFRSRTDAQDLIVPASTVDAVTGASLNSRFDLESMGLGADGTALPQATDAQANDNLLDFDLGGLSFEPVAVDNGAGLDADATAVPDLQFEMEPFAPLEPASGMPVVESGAGSNVDDLAFDMNFDTPAAAPANDDQGYVLDLSKDAQVGDVGMAGVPSEFDLAPAAGETGVDTAATQAKDSLFDLDAMDFGLADTTPVTPVGQQGEPVFDFGGTDLDLAPAAAETPAPAVADAAKEPMFDLDNLDFGQPAAPAAPQDDPFALDDVPAIPNPGTPVPRFDMSGLDLELPAADADLTAQPLAEAGESVAAEGGGNLELTPAQMEMETKLDLAIAYQEIGDKEGARELLDEVIKGGNVEQASRASSMRAQLA